MPIKALFFDVGNTLLFPNHSEMLKPLQQRSIFPSAELLRKIECSTKKEFDSLQASHAKIDHGFWHIYYTHLLDELGCPDDTVCAELVARTRLSRNWCEIRPHTRELLKDLGRDYRLGVISNADGKIAAVLETCGIADCFESITDSGIVGHEKPHPAIFAAALESLGVSPQESLYTGDVYSVDYVGATEAGMRAVLFDVCGAYRDDGPPCIESLDELALVLSAI
jgi:HAD superfamily hydrolase (TIGR01509 family)